MYLNLRLVGSLHGQSEAAGSGVPRLDDKLVVFVDEAPLQAVAVSLHLVRIATGLDRDLWENKNRELGNPKSIHAFPRTTSVTQKQERCQTCDYGLQFPGFFISRETGKARKSRVFPGISREIPLIFCSLENSRKNPGNPGNKPYL